MNTTTNGKITDKEKHDLLGPVYQVKEMEHGILEKYGHVYVVDADEKDNIPFNCTDTYNAEGHRIKKERMWSKVKKTTIYDLNGFITERYSHKEDGSLKSRWISKNNESGEILEDISFDENDQKICSSKRYYDEKRNCIKVISYDKDDKATSITNWVYGIENKRNDWTECIQQDGNGKFKSWTKNTINHKGETMETAHLKEDGSIIDKTSYAENYDSEGNWIVPFNDRKNKELYKTIVENDHHGNWIIKVNYFGIKPISVFKRRISYIDETALADINTTIIESPLKLFNPVTVETTENCIWRYIHIHHKYDLENGLSQKEAKWLAEKSASPDAFPYFNYYILKNDEIPSQIVYTCNNVEVMAFLKNILASGEVNLIHTYHINSNNNGEQLIRYTLSFVEDPAYLIHILQIQESDTDEYDIPDFMREEGIGEDGQVRTSQIIVLYPSLDFGKDDPENIISTIEFYMERNMMEEIPEKPEIFMVEVANNGFSLESHYVNDDFEIKELDVNYGFGFEQFHTELIQRFTTEHKGLVLFHGIPGTGKTYYIRHLLREMAIANKIVIYMPPNMVDYLSEPEFMTFLFKTVADYSSRNLTCVLLIEDAEPLLVARHNEGRVQGITNLLNMSDGLLNDMLKLQIICTFNCELKQLDAALLRPGRLIARKEFKALPELEANILAQRLGVKYHFEEPATLSEIYAKIKNQNTIIHEE